MHLNYRPVVEAVVLPSFQEEEEVHAWPLVAEVEHREEVRHGEPVVGSCYDFAVPEAVNRSGVAPAASLYYVLLMHHLQLGLI